ncbi:MAG TPA: leucine--tRNA ligase [Phycisphaerales bacterium]|nr:leucine--tRNA ligase [Phycisphaerales bacterium]
MADEIERRWQAYWEQHQTFRAPNPGQEGFDPARPKYYILDMFPYPSGAGLHVGHPEGYTATDILARYRRMLGFSVLHPMGWDAFGLPAEQYAIQTGVHPALTTRKAIDTFRRQLKRFGFSYDWAREVATIDPDYYRWTQWIWLRAYDSWYDPEAPRADGGRGRARPIRELLALMEGGDGRVNAFGELVYAGPAAGLSAFSMGGTDPVGTRRWHELAETEQRRFIDERRLAYLDEVMVNWCPRLGTVLANEEVIDGRSERGGHPVYRRPLKQWMFRITAYADRLLADLALVDWPASTRTQQAEWIGRSEGAEIEFPLDLSDLPPGAAAESGESLVVFTTRPDTVFGATYMVIAPEHPLVERVLAAPPPGCDAAAVRAYVRAARDRAELDRAAAKSKTGIALGVHALNPASGARIPVWIADYVLMGYGSGAIMAVPAHDLRDFEFAGTFGLPIVEVVRPEAPPTAPAGADTPGCFTGEGVGVNSSGPSLALDGLPTTEAKRRVIAWLRDSGQGRARVNYRLRDWLFSRQRYWGEPFPVVYDERGRPYPVAEHSLPVKLPDLEDYRPAEADDPTPLLAKATGWTFVTAATAGVDPDVLPPTAPVTRETNTMPGWAGSCWYYLRYCDPHNDERFVGREAERYWMDGAGVDLYVGGAEHAVLHLLYARFWHKILYDLGEVTTPEPFKKLFHQGLITSHAFQRPDRSLVPVDQADEISPGVFVERGTGQPLTSVVAKMSKSLKNVINPDEVIAQYGADTFRLYEMYMGPLEATKPWNTRDIVGPHRFLQRVWRHLVDEQTGRLTVLNDPPDEPTLRLLHRTIAGVRRDLEALAFNTAIAKLIELNNHLGTLVGAGRPVPRQVAEPFVLMLAPLAPHLAEELWARLGHTRTLAYHPYPEADPALCAHETVEVPVQVAGKVRGRVRVPAGAGAPEVEAAALADPGVVQFLAGRPVKKVVVVPGKMVSIVPG